MRDHRISETSNERRTRVSDAVQTAEGAAVDLPKGALKVSPDEAVAEGLKKDAQKAGARVGLTSDEIIINGGRPLTGRIEVREDHFDAWATETVIGVMWEPEHEAELFALAQSFQRGAR